MTKTTKKGYTLIELLAVIVVMTIILVITTPIIVNTIENVRKNAFKISTLEISRTAQTKIAQNLLKGYTGSVTFTYENGIETSFPEGYKLDYKGARPKSGIVIANKNGKIGTALHNGRWCALKGFEDTEVTLKELNEEECVRQIKPLTVTLNGSEKEYVEINTSYEEYGAFAITIEGDIIEDYQREIRYNNEIVEDIDVSKLRTYEIIYIVEYNGYTTGTKREVIIQDTMPPVLTIPSNVTIAIEEVKTFDYLTDVTITDNSLEIISPTLTSELKPYPGEYTIVYSAKDSSGNEISKTRYITVIDVGYPKITIIGENPINIDMGTAYIDLGATAVDDVDGNITDKIITTGTVNINVPGIYVITYEVEDNSKNKTSVTRTVNVIDSVPPEVIFGTDGNSTNAKTRNTTVTITDNVNVDANSLKYLWNTSTTTPSEVSFSLTFANGGTITTPVSVSGGYYLWILARDVAGNTSIQRSNVFNLDNQVPVITGVDISTSNLKYNGFTITRSGSATDAHSGLSTNPYIYQTSPNGSSWTTRCTNNTTTCVVTGLTEKTTYYYRMCVEDVLGHLACVASKQVATTEIMYYYDKYYVQDTSTYSNPRATSGSRTIESLSGYVQIVRNRSDIGWDSSRGFHLLTSPISGQVGETVWYLNYTTEIGQLKITARGVVYPNDYAGTYNAREKCDVSTTKSRGSLITTVQAANGTYPDNGIHTDGYWYVKEGIAN